MIPGLDLCTDTSWEKKKKDLRELSRLHGSQLRICRKKADKTISGVYDQIQNKINLVSSDTKRNRLSDEDILYIFCHELGHAIQYQLISVTPDNVQNKFFGIFENIVKLEQTAESLAYFLSLNYFPTLSVRVGISKKDYNTYFKVEDIAYLAEWNGFDADSEEVIAEISKIQDKS